MLELLKDFISFGFYAVYRLFPTIRGQELALLYHSVCDVDYKKDHNKLNVLPSLFKDHLALLSNLKNKKVILTFDDGFSNFFNEVFPVILKSKLNAILFVTVGFIEGEINLNQIFNNKFRLKPLTWKQIREISDSGIEIGSHTLTHRNLAKLKENEARKEIMDSKKRIEDAIGKGVRYFSYPYGGRNAFNKDVKMMVKDSGYEKAFTNIMGFNNSERDSYELNRIRIYGSDNLFRFRLKINGAYNWIDFLTGYNIKE